MMHHIKIAAKPLIIIRNITVYFVSKTTFLFGSLQKNLLVISNFQTETNFNISGQPQCPSCTVGAFGNILIKHGAAQKIPLLLIWAKYQDPEEWLDASGRFDSKSKSKTKEIIKMLSSYWRRNSHLKSQLTLSASSVFYLMITY